MSSPGKAIESPGIRLTPEQIAQLNSICDQTLRAHPELTPWIRKLSISNQDELRFLPIRCFRTNNVSRLPNQTSLKSSLVPWAREFLSSGSTNSNRAKHRMSTAGLDAYRVSACQGLSKTFTRFNIPLTIPIISFVPPQELWPDSSLAAMLSFWKEAGFQVQFLDLNSGESEFEQAILTLKNLSELSRKLAIFGTSIHHLQVTQWQRKRLAGQPFISAEQVWCFDTGGTKGRTQSVRQDDLYSEIKKWFTHDCQLSILSEYGMCELASQAYSLNSPHDNIFECSDNLKVISVSPDFSHIQPAGKLGFLGFIDFANIDSWPYIITEDLGWSIDINHTQFKLEGRAPDSTTKGCSLNVRSSYRFDLKTPQQQQKDAELHFIGDAESKRRLFSSERLLAALQKDVWPPSALNDLMISLKGWNCTINADTLATNSALKNEAIAAITSANIPMTWLFPAFHAWTMSAKVFHLYLPSIRQDDPISAAVRLQIETLSKAFNDAAETNFIQLKPGRILVDEHDTDMDRIIIFGTDDTIQTISAEFQKQKKRTKIIALGHFQNQLRARKKTDSQKIAQMCSLWLGRGCLTPINILLPQNWSLLDKKEFCHTLFEQLCSEFKRRFSEYEKIGFKTLQPFSHQHNLIEALFEASQSHQPCEVLRRPDSGVVLANLTMNDQIQYPFLIKLSAFGGCGWVNVFNDNVKPQLPEENPSPTLWENHQGHLWRDWFFKTTASVE